ncbi:hypothetical protein MH117_19160 [Paenibacillus sp. ACRRX]|uniref:hypothetical protein n=1 Tax=Paenibacillus sp. ACRRX TaxID=2918206 RepID=UPI001EF66A72|nr:hypothetical protein [Paenibacillus sp. ACRRX]MCG7409531.1 hypothetical protein [Paenibacillus sp. ACRRX]
MNRIAAVVKMHSRDKWSWFVLPWLILFLSFFVNFIIAFSINNDEGFTSGGLASIFIYLFVIGVVTIAQTFVFAVSLSIRRKDYFLGTAISIAIVSAVSTVILLLLGALEHGTAGWGFNLHFFHLAYLNDGTFMQQLWIYFSFFLHLFYCGFVISSLHRRYGRNGLYVFFIASFLVGAAGSYLLTYYRLWLDIFSWIGQYTIFQHSLWIFVLTVLYAGISYLLLRRATV